MKLTKLLTLTLAMIAVSACAPRNDTQYYSIQEALNSPEAKEVLNPKIKLYFGKAAPGKTVRAGVVSNKKTNTANKSDKASCQWAFLSAVKSFQERAEREGATKVGNLISYYKKVPYSSTTQFECHAGHLMSGVALRGDIVR